MLHSTFILSVFASAVAAQGSSLPADSLLPSFAIVTPGATIEPPTSITPKVMPTSTSVDNDQPDPYNSSIQLPASLSFNPSKAPAFSASAGVPNPSSNVVYSSTPCSTVVTVTATSTPIDNDQPDPHNTSIQLPASESFNPSNAPAFTATSGGVNPSLNPVYPSSTPCSSEITPTSAPSTAVPIETTTLKTPSNGKATPITSSTLVRPTPTPAPKDDDEPCDEDDKTPSNISAPISSAPARPTNLSPVPTSNRPSYPISGPRPAGVGRPSNRPAFGWGRPRPAGAWPSRGAARPTGGFGRRPRPTPPSRPVVGKGNAKSTPCTLETRVRPTPTAA